MPYFGMLRSVDHIRTDDSEEPSAYIIRVTRIGELGATLGVTSNPCMPRSNIKSNKYYFFPAFFG
jgi:hypothetical protein